MDPSSLEEKLGLTKEEIDELVELFIDTCKDDIERLRTGFEENNARQISEAAHSIKGASGNMRADTMFELAKSIEAVIRAGDLPQVAPMIDQLESNLQEISKNWSSE